MFSIVGAPIEHEYFTDAERDRFVRRLDDQLRALEVVLARPDFGGGRRTLGVELEQSLVDESGRAYPIAERLARDAHADAITPELGAFDIEFSTDPVPLDGRPFTATRRKMEATASRISELAARRGARAVPIGILPTLRLEDFTAATVTPRPRYRALVREMREGCSDDFTVAIEGEDQLRLTSHDVVTMEGANAAFQIHLSTTADEFARLFNAALLLTGPVLAGATNSPTFLGKRLWHETRVALFKQAGDDRPTLPDKDFMRPPRIDFGSGWVRDGAHELFLESVALHSVLLAECRDEEDSLGLAMAGEVPMLSELRLHHGTVWNWIRPVYDPNPNRGGGLRIELRALSAGPTYDDMLANASFLVGAMLGIADRASEYVQHLPFASAKQNFFLAAQHGLDAELTWPSEGGGAPTRLRARDLLLELLPSAHAGLADAGVDAEERDYFLGVFEARVRSGKTSSVWQRETLDRLHAEGHRGYRALTELLDRYLAGVESQRPVHTWPVDPRGSTAARTPTEDHSRV